MATATRARALMSGLGVARVVTPPLPFPTHASGFFNLVPTPLHDTRVRGILSADPPFGPTSDSPLSTADPMEPATNESVDAWRCVARYPRSSRDSHAR